VPQASPILAPLLSAPQVRLMTITLYSTSPPSPAFTVQFSVASYQGEYGSKLTVPISLIVKPFCMREDHFAMRRPGPSPLSLLIPPRRSGIRSLSGSVAI
jgi:hypothetical protein